MAQRRTRRHLTAEIERSNIGRDSLCRSKKINGFNPFDRHDNHDDNGPDFSNFGGFLNSILQHNSQSPSAAGSQPAARSHAANSAASTAPATNQPIRPPSPPIPTFARRRRLTSTGRRPHADRHRDQSAHDQQHRRRPGRCRCSESRRALGHDVRLGSVHRPRSRSDQNRAPIRINDHHSVSDAGSPTVGAYRYRPRGDRAGHRQRRRDNPATAVNSITGWLDASMVYGSDAATAASLRLPDGHMKTSVGDNLPIDPNIGTCSWRATCAPPRIPRSDGAADVVRARAQLSGRSSAREAPDLDRRSALSIRARHRRRRKSRTSPIDEFLPHLSGRDAIDAVSRLRSDRRSDHYRGVCRRGLSLRPFDRFRLDIEKIGEQGQELAERESLKDVVLSAGRGFFAPMTAPTRSCGRSRLGSDPRRWTSASSTICATSSSIRRICMDLAAINIQRGRDLGLGTLNETSDALGLTGLSRASARSRRTPTRSRPCGSRSETTWTWSICGPADWPKATRRAA